MVQGVFVPFHVKLLLPFAETVQTVISMVCNLQVILPSTRRREMKGRKREVNKLKNWQLVDYMCTKRSNTNTGSVWWKTLWNNWNHTESASITLLLHLFTQRSSKVITVSLCGIIWLSAWIESLNSLLLHTSILCATVRGNTGNSSGQWVRFQIRFWPRSYLILLQ